MVMPSNNTGIRIGHLAGKYPGQLGHLFSPGAQRGPYEFMPYALDNERFSAWAHKKAWDRSKWIALLEWARLSGQRPLWALVPDVVADKDATLRDWAEYAPIVKSYGWPLAFAVQDGMEPVDVPSDADVIFVGGTTEWKWRTAAMWCSAFQRVHVGRVNTWKRLVDADRAGAESVDGTGWTRGDQRQWRDPRAQHRPLPGLPTPSAGRVHAAEARRGTAQQRRLRSSRPRRQARGTAADGTGSGVDPMSRTLILLIRTVHLIREYHAGFLETGDTRYAWGLAEAQYEIEKYLIPELTRGL